MGKELKHTKGEWKIRSDAPYSVCGFKVYSGVGKNNKTIVHLPYGAVVPPIYDESYYETEANAKLIAAAPELLEAVQNAMQIVDLWSLPDNEVSEEFADEAKVLRAMQLSFEKAIKKAIE